MSDFASLWSLESFADGTAGAMGGCSAISFFYPLNKVRTELQTSDPSKKARSAMKVLIDILETDGFAGLYKGWWSQMVALGVSNFIYFYTYNVLKIAIQKHIERRITPGLNLVIGALAGMVNVLLTSPLWMVCTQIAVQNPSSNTKPYKGLIDGLVRCGQEEGIVGLWKGVIPNLLLVSNPTLHFFAYERMRGVLEKVAIKRGFPIRSIEFFWMGALAKMFSTFLTYPVQLAQSQLRNDRKAGKEGKRKYKGTVDCILKIYLIAGVSGLFRGFFAKLWQTVLTAAFQFMTFEKLRVLVFRVLTGKEGRVKVKA